MKLNKKYKEMLKKQEFDEYIEYPYDAQSIINQVIKEMKNE